jgi:ribose transport system permease protein
MSGTARPVLTRARDLGIVLAVVVLFVILSVSSSGFLTTTNLLNVVAQWSPTTIMAIGGTVVLIVGGFDLSIASIFVVGAVVATKLNSVGVPAVPAMLGGVLAGMLAGAINGTVTTVGRVNPFVTTIVTAIILDGLSSVITGGNLIIASSPSFTWIGQDSILGIQVSIWLLVAFGLTVSLVLNRTWFGRYAFATGGNREAARLSGIRVDLTTATAFAVSGLSGGLAGLIVASQTGSASTSLSSGTVETDVFAAMLLGGNSILGGEGAIWRTVMGAILIALIGNGFDLLNVNPLYQQVASGIIILAAVILDRWTRRKTQS